VEKQEIEKIQRRFELLYQECYFARQEFFLLKKLMKSYDLESNYRELIVTIFDALESSILMKLAKAYDKDYEKNSITVYYILNTILSNKQFNKNDKYIKEYVKTKKEELEKNDVIPKLTILRDKCQAHLDRKYEKGMKSIKYEDKMYFEELENLVENTYNIVKKCMEIIGNCTVIRDTSDILGLQYDGIIKAIEKYRNV
jgi:hypothetical protein